MTNNFDNIEYLCIVLILILFAIMICKKSNEHQKLLEFPKNYYFGKENFNINSNILKTELEKFCEKLDGKYNFIVSLSGGVDSMVTLALLCNIIPKEKIVTASVDYNQRNESTEEINFLKEYLRNHKIENYSVKVNVGRRKTGEVKRKVFEESSQKIRYDLYKDIIKQKKWNKNRTIILLGHHNDDLVENIFNNFMLGRSLNDLEVMREISLKEKLIFGRPFLKYPKSIIYGLAHDNNIPYFKDTTPLWSKRGLMRKKLFPLLQEIYPNGINSLKKQGIMSFNLNKLIDENFVSDFISKVKREVLGDKIIFNWSNELNSQSKIVCKERLSAILHSSGVPMISSKSLDIFMRNKIHKKENVLSKYVSFRRTKDETILILEKK